MASLSLAGLVVCAVGWVQASRAPAIEKLSTEARQALVGDLMEATPGIYQWAYFEPRIGYSLRPDADLSAWGDRFHSNALGYRTGAPAKAPGTFRVLFVGDSWTFGMGVKREESFPEAFAALANQHAALGRAAGGQQVEAWSLALPGYNTFNELAALWFYYDRLQPDAVVLCLAQNDNHSGFAILPNGSATSRGIERDEFGDPHHVAYQGRLIDSYRYQLRWRRCFEAIRQAELRLRALDTPFMVAFVGRFQEVQAHAAIARAGIEAPYVVVPIELAKGSWSQPRWGHGTPAAYQLYGRMIYRGMSRLLGWPALPPGDDRGDVPVYGPPPPGTDWPVAWDRECAATTDAMPDTFRPGSKSLDSQAVGPLEGRTGVMDRGTTILVRYRPGASHLVVTVRRLDESPTLYPLPLTLSIPSPDGGSRIVTTVAADGPAQQRFDLPIPRDLRPGSALDVVVEAGGAAVAPNVLAGRSLVIVAIDNA